LAGHENVHCTIAVDIHEADLISRLILIDAVFREVSLAVVFKPGENPGIF